MSWFERNKLAATIVACLSLLAVAAPALGAPTLPTPEYVGTTFETFQNAAEWTVTGGTAVNESSRARLMPLTLRLTSDLGAEVRADKAISVDLSKALSVSFWVYQAVPDLPWTDGSIELWSNVPQAKRLIASWSMHPGWNRIVIPKCDFVSFGGATWLDRVVRVRLKLFAVKDRSTVCHFDELGYSAFHLATVILAFDDGYPSHYTEAFPYLQSYGFPGTLYLTHGQVRVGGLTEPQIAEMYNAGWDVCNHSYTHATPLKNPDYDTAVADYGSMSSYLASKGWTRNNCHLHVAYPWGMYSDGTLRAMADLGMLTGRLAYGRLQANVLDERYLLPAYTVSGGPSAWMSKIDRVASNGGCLFLVFHGISSAPGDVTPSDFRTIVDHIAVLRSYGMLQVLPMTGWYASL